MGKFKKIFAKLLSRLLDPVWEIPLALLLAIGFAVREGIRWRFVGLLLFIDAVVPLIFFLTMLYHKQIKDWDIQNRAERIPLYMFTLACHLVGIWVAHLLGKSELVSVLLIYYVTAIVFFAITFFWKISLHSGVNAMLITSLNVFYGGKFAWMYILVLFVMWARVYQKHHTWSQALMGAILGTLLVGGGLTLL